jgi:predicted AAA+ superfamily ATPase
MKIQREQLAEFKERMLESRRFIQVLYGPRQVGKTTLILQLLKEYKQPSLFVTGDDVGENDATWIATQWQNARHVLEQSGASEFLLVIDEVQKLANWSENIKKLWDADTRNEVNIKLILLGSSRLMIQQGLTESLAGRFESTYLGHWTFTEMEQAFDWNVQQYIWFGGYPGSADLITDEKRWREYVLNSLIETSISKDILMLTRVDKPALMKRLFELGSIYSGQILSFNKILGQLTDAGNTTTLTHYLQLLHSAGLLGGIEKYSPALIRQRAASPKFQVHNSAIISAQQNRNLSEVKNVPKDWGRWAESAVGAHLMNHSIKANYKLHYWRENNYEVDYVLANRESVVALEVKSGVKQRISGLSEFKKRFPEAKIYLIGDDGIPIENFLRTKPSEFL